MVVGKFRSQFAALNIAKNANPEIFIRCSDPTLKKIFDAEAAVFKSLIRSGATNIISPADPDPAGCLKNYLNDKITIYVKAEDLIDKEVERVEKRNAQLQDLKQKLEKKMQIKDYATKVPEPVRKRNEAKLASYQDEIDANLKSIEELKELVN